MPKIYLITILLLITSLSKAQDNFEAANQAYKAAMQKSEYVQALDQAKKRIELAPEGQDSRPTFIRH
jgi:exonuclease VII small subunit